MGGLEPGKHGFHVHESYHEENVGGHFNPHQVNHGEPGMKNKRHVGDLGNILVSAEDGKMANIDILDDVISLDTTAENGIIGKVFVIHADEDDLGLGGDDGSTIN